VIAAVDRNAKTCREVGVRMELLEGIVHVGTDTEPGHASVGAFVKRLEQIGARYNVTCQAFDARYIVSARHLERAVELADRERARGSGIARDRGVEVLLYAAGRRQIDQALELGIGQGETPAVVLLSVEDEGNTTAAAAAARKLLVPEDTLGAYDKMLVKNFFNVGERELAATDAGLESLVLERVALLVIDR
jgi:KEOPS complex subunit Cgi121